MPEDPKDHHAHIPVAKRLSGDLGTPVEVLADKSLSTAQKRDILRVWLKDLEPQPQAPEVDQVRRAITDALRSLDAA